MSIGAAPVTMGSRLHIACHPLDLRRLHRTDTALLDSSERTRADRFRFDIHRNRYISAHAQVRRILAAHLDIRPEWLKLASTRLGKPIVAPSTLELRSNRGAPSCHFSLSHCDDIGWLAIATTPVGIDVEIDRPFPDLAALIESTCTAHESATLRTLPLERRTSAFLSLWTRKEAVLKAWGSGIGAVALDSLEVGLEADRIRPLGSSKSGRSTTHVETAALEVAVVNGEKVAAAAAPLRLQTMHPAGQTLSVAVATSNDCEILLHDAEPPTIS